MSARFSFGVTLLETIPVSRALHGSSASTDVASSSAVGTLPKAPAGIPGVTAVLPVPGFEDAPIAIAMLKDGSGLILDLRGSAKARVAAAGCFASIYRVRRDRQTITTERTRSYVHYPAKETSAGSTLPSSM